jgi:transglutaminase-like putative cysteine protease
MTTLPISDLRHPTPDSRHPVVDNRRPTTDNRKQDLELLFLTMFSAIPLYVTQTISMFPLLAFHAAMLAITVRVYFGKGPEVIPPMVMRALAIAYIPFYVVDAALISRSAIAASTHLVLFIAVYQPIESVRSRNTTQRLLTAALIALASVATATHIAILPFIILFGVLLLRQLMQVSHDETEAMTGRSMPAPPIGRAAAFYVLASMLLGAVFFPFLPRIRNPLLPNLSSAMEKATTGISDSINLNEPRSIATDATVVSRVWMGPDAIPFFTPLRLRGTVYERFTNNTWRQGRYTFVPIDSIGSTARVARPEGLTRRASVQQRFPVGNRLFLPVGTYQVTGAGQVVEGPTRDIYSVWQPHRDNLSYDIAIAHSTAPLRPQRVRVANYPVTPAVRALARQIVGNETAPLRRAAAIESYLSTRFRYVPDPAAIGHTMTVDQFLLQERRGHCEYFAAGMVALMTALDVPARIAGGFYGGTLNPLTGYFIIRREDAHAWVEVWDGQTWQTFDPTPAALRPGNAHEGLVRMYAAALSDWVNYFWDRHILTFGLGDQVALASDMIDSVRTAIAAMSAAARRAAQPTFTRGYALLLAALILAGFAALVLSRRRQPVFNLLADHLRKLGIEVGPAMTMEEALAEVRRTQPAAAAALVPLISLYEAERFSASEERGRVRRIRKGLTELKT